VKFKKEVERRKGRWFKYGGEIPEQYLLAQPITHQTLLHKLMKYKQKILRL
jgi:hypothetical protein